MSFGETIGEIQPLNIGWGELACAWQRAYELQGANIDERSRDAAAAYIQQILTAKPLDAQFADQQAQLREYTSNL